jgi:hypothetical protein
MRHTGISTTAHMIICDLVITAQVSTSTVGFLLEYKEDAPKLVKIPLQPYYQRLNKSSYKQSKQFIYTTLD